MTVVIIRTPECAYPLFGLFSLLAIFERCGTSAIGQRSVIAFGSVLKW